MTRDLIAAVILAFVAIAYYLAASGLGRSALSDEVGAAGLPTVYALALGIVALSLGLGAVIRAWSRRAPDRPAAGGSATGFALARAAGVLGIGIGYLLIVDWVGYFLALAALLAAMLLYQSVRPSPRIALAAVGGAGLFWLLFDRLLGVPMPAPWGL